MKLTPEQAELDQTALDEVYATRDLWKSRLANARTLLSQGCAGMTVADAAEFVELIETGEDDE